MDSHHYTVSLISLTSVINEALSLTPLIFRKSDSILLHVIVATASTISLSLTNLKCAFEFFSAVLILLVSHRLDAIIRCSEPYRDS